MSCFFKIYLCWLLSVYLRSMCGSLSFCWRNVSGIWWPLFPRGGQLRLGEPPLSDIFILQWESQRGDCWYQGSTSSFLSQAILLWPQTCIPHSAKQGPCRWWAHLFWTRQLSDMLLYLTCLQSPHFLTLRSYHYIPPRSSTLLSGRILG